MMSIRNQLREVKIMATTPKTITPSVLATELEVDAKRVRAYLRKNFARPVEAKNSTWNVPADAAKAVREHFAKKA